MVPFVAVHLMLFFSMPWPIALVSTILAVIISFPLAYLFELGGATIWAPAILHFVIQATVKILVFPEGAEAFALAWMAASATIPLLVFAVKAPTRRLNRRRPPPFAPGAPGAASGTWTLRRITRPSTSSSANPRPDDTDAIAPTLRLQVAGCGSCRVFAGVFDI